MASISGQEVIVVDVALSAFAILITCIRLLDRIRKHLFWWDDAYVVIAVLCGTAFMAGNILQQCSLASCATSGFRTTSFYLTAESFYSAIWTARLSILFTVVRICPNWIVRNVLLAVGGMFFVAWGFLLGQVLFICEKHPDWKDGATNGRCVLGNDVVIAQIITVVIADILLIILPLRFIWRVSIERGRKIRLTCVFASTIVMTCLNIYHAITVSQISSDDSEHRFLAEEIAGIIEVSATLTISNLSVIFAVIFRMGRDDNPNNRRSIIMRDLSNTNRTTPPRHRSSPSISTCPSVSGTNPFSISEVVTPETEREAFSNQSLGRRGGHPLRVKMRRGSGPGEDASHTESWDATAYSEDEDCRKWDTAQAIEESPKTAEGEIAFQMPMLAKR